MAEEEKTTVQLKPTMICVCNDEGKAEAAALMKEVTERLAGGSEELAERPIPPEEFLTCVVQSLNWDYGAYISTIGNDMWSGVSVEKYDKSVAVWAECDYVEHGVAAAWKALADYEAIQESV